MTEAQLRQIHRPGDHDRRLVLDRLALFLDLVFLLFGGGLFEVLVERLERAALLGGLTSLGLF